MINRIFLNLGLALDGIKANKLRSILTALGIIFGVGAVIAMLAIGSGARQSILDQMKLIGTNNIVIKTLDNSGEGGEDGDDEEEEDGKKSWSPGLSLSDVKAIKEVLPTIDLVSPEI